jgi:nicotinamidase-related amidase
MINARGIAFIVVDMLNDVCASRRMALRAWEEIT